MEVTPMVPKSQTREKRPTSLSPFERLPLELRQEIYSYLGVPIARKLHAYDPENSETVIRYTFGHWDADLAMLKQYGYDGTACDLQTRLSHQFKLRVSYNSSILFIC
jgi:hypothetical protein